MCHEPEFLLAGLTGRKIGEVLYSRSSKQSDILKTKPICDKKVIRPTRKFKVNCSLDKILLDRDNRVKDNKAES